MSGFLVFDICVPVFANTNYECLLIRAPIAIGVGSGPRGGAKSGSSMNVLGQAKIFSIQFPLLRRGGRRAGVVTTIFPSCPDKANQEKLLIRAPIAIGVGSEQFELVFGGAK